MLKMLKLLYDNGILIVPGTDGGESGAGEANALHFELSLYTQAGIPANQVLRIATFNCAVDCNLQNKYGEIRPGLDADFILIDGDPINNIDDIRRVEWVVKNKKVYHPKQLLASKGWKYYYR
jgi:imidazolonepropionase-like amidohydrolase